MPQSQRLSPVIPFVTIERPACPKCKAPMMLVSFELARPRVDLHTFEVQGSWTLASRRFTLTQVRRAGVNPRIL
jgi:hypothetical protein